MVDQTLNRREAILTRIFDLGKTLPVAAAVRNHGPAETGSFGLPRPAFVLYDSGAVQVWPPREEILRLKDRKIVTTIWRMDPQILILPVLRDNLIDNLQLNGQDNPIGPELSAWEQLVDNVIANDSVLLDLVTAGGTHIQTGFETDFKVGRRLGSLGAWLLMLYDFYYPRFPSRS